MAIETSPLSRKEISHEGRRNPYYGGRPPKEPKPEDVQFIEDHASLSIGRICEELGVSRNTLMRWQREGKIWLGSRPMGRPRKSDIDPNFPSLVRDLNVQGFNERDIASKVHAASSTVRRYLKEPKR